MQAAVKNIGRMVIKIEIITTKAAGKRCQHGEENKKCGNGQRENPDSGKQQRIYKINHDSGFGVRLVSTSEEPDNGKNNDGRANQIGHNNPKRHRRRPPVVFRYYALNKKIYQRVSTELKKNDEPSKKNGMMNAKHFLPWPKQESDKRNKEKTFAIGAVLLFAQWPGSFVYFAAELSNGLSAVRCKFNYFSSRRAFYSSCGVAF